ncbi:MAG: hypothetical protein HY782_00500 [Chloroflexi bacterium]|nr:hypothetical protein [Chloroflexota bacterium]
MRRPKTLQAFSRTEFIRAHALLAAQVATMMGRKFEEGDWSYVYHTAKRIPYGGWSNLNIDVMFKSLGVEHKMLCVHSDKSIREYCGTSLMHPAATRSIRISSMEGDPTQVAHDVLRQYAELIEQRRQLVGKNNPGALPDMRVGWLLWQESLREFLYFEEEMLPPVPDDFWAEWRESSGGTRKPSRNLWIYEKETGKKRYSVTTVAGAKIQPYFDVPAPNDPNLYCFWVQGQELPRGLVRIWITATTALLLKQVLENVDSKTVSSAIISAANRASEVEEKKKGSKTAKLDAAEPLLLTAEAYNVLKAAFPGVSDEHMIQLFLHFVTSQS